MESWILFFFGKAKTVQKKWSQWTIENGCKISTFNWKCKLNCVCVCEKVLYFVVFVGLQCCVVKFELWIKLIHHYWTSRKKIYMVRWCESICEYFYIAMSVQSPPNNISLINGFFIIYFWNWASVFAHCSGRIIFNTSLRLDSMKYVHENNVNSRRRKNSTQ